MSSMLEQAVIDADALREVAIKNAEAAVIEKYAVEVKDAVQRLLEQQDDLEMELEPLEEPTSTDPIIDDMPLAATDGEVACPCPDEETVYRINLDQLMPDVDKEAEEVVGPETHEQAAEDVTGTLDDEELFETVEETLETIISEEVGENISIDDENLSAIIEKLTVDTPPTKSGWAGTPDSAVSTQEEQLLAQEQDDDVKEENEALRKSVEKLEENNRQMKHNISEENKKIQNYEETLEYLTKTISETNLVNARLLYTNKVLTSDSLNERQKENIVDALSKAKTVEEAKVIYDTLQSTAGAPTQRASSESLSEAINKTSSTILLSRTKTREGNNNGQESDRWKILAGIK